MTIPVVLLAIVVAYSAAILWRGRTFRFRLRRTTAGHGHAAVLRSWATGIALSFGVPAAFGLMLLGYASACESLPAPFLPLLFQLGARGLLLTPGPLLIGMVGGTIVNVAVSLWRVRSGRMPFLIGRAPALAATSRADLMPAVLLSISAGVSEELYFRLFVPVLIALVSGSALLGFAVATLLFGAAHRYQGTTGIIATTLVGAVLGYVYLASGALWLAMLFHVVIDLNALVVRGAIGGAWQR